MLTKIFLTALLITALSTFDVSGECAPEKSIHDFIIELFGKDLANEGFFNSRELIKLAPIGKGKVFESVSSSALGKAESELWSNMEHKSYRPTEAQMEEYLKKLLETPIIGRLCTLMKNYPYPGFEDLRACQEKIHDILMAVNPKSEKQYTAFEAIYWGGEKKNFLHQTVYTGALSWITLYMGEKHGLLQLNLKKVTDVTPDVKILTVDVTINGKKFESSTILGMKPEFDIALAMLCFLGEPKGTISIEMGHRVLKYTTEAECPKKGKRYLTNIKYGV